MLIDITIDGNILFVLIIIIVIAIISLIVALNENKSKAHKLELDNVQKDVTIEKIQAETQTIAQQNASALFEEWKKKELLAYMKVIEDSGIEKAQALLNQWKINEEERIRKDAANRSVRNVLGKVTEHLIPFSEAMKQFNPKDIRFIGSPIDLIVFEGAEELKKDQVTIWFVEVKTGTSALSKRQQIIKEAVQSRRVEWMRVDMKSFGDDVNEALSS